MKSIGDTSWRGKPLHGKYHLQIAEVAVMTESFQWQEMARLKDGTGAGLEHQSDRSPELPHQPRSKVQAVEKGTRNNQASSHSGM